MIPAPDVRIKYSGWLFCFIKMWRFLVVKMHVPLKCKSNVEPRIAGLFLFNSGSLLEHYTMTIFTNLSQLEK